MNRKETIEKVRDFVAKSKDLTYLTETNDNIIWCWYTGWDSFTEIFSKKNINYEHLGEIEYKFFDLDFGNSDINEYRYKSNKIDCYIYVYEWSHGCVDTVDYISYYSLKRLSADEIHKILRLHDMLILDSIKKMREGE